MLRLHSVVVLAFTSALFGCGQSKTEAPTPSPSEVTAKASGFSLTSPAFKDGEPIPVKHTADGEGISPQLDWTGAPGDTKDFALILDDPDAPSGTFTHWVICAIPMKAASLSEGVPTKETVPASGGIEQGTNSAGGIGYFPPSPPPGKLHHYVFRLYALDAATGLQPGATADELRKAMDGHLLATATLTGTYQRAH